MLFLTKRISMFDVAWQVCTVFINLGKKLLQFSFSSIAACEIPIINQFLLLYSLTLFFNFIFLRNVVFFAFMTRIVEFIFVDCFARTSNCYLYAKFCLKIYVGTSNIGIFRCTV